MKSRFFISAIVLLFVFSGATFCHGSSGIQEPLETCVTRQWPHELSDLAPDSDIVFGRLDNGFRYALKKNRQPKDRTAILLDVNVGSLYELDEERGIAHFLEHMVFNGSTNFKPGELVEYFQDIGMSFGGDTNAYTTYDNTVYKIILPSSEKKMLEEGLLVMRDYARGALLDEAEIDRERGVILSEMNERNTASYRTYKQSSMFTLDGTLLPKRFAIGRQDVLEGADRAQIKRFYDKWYRPENMTLVMVGDFDTGQAEEAIIRQFSSMRGSSEPFTCPELGTLDHSGIKSFYYHEPDLGHTSVSIEVLKNKQPENDSFSLQVKNLHRYMAARILNFRLDQEREDQNSVISSARFSIRSILDHYLHSAITARTGGENWKEALAAISRVLNQALEYGFTREETEMVQDELIAYLERAVQTKDSIDSLDIARNIVNSLNNNRVIQSAVQEEMAYTAVIKNTSETDLHNALLEIWDQDVRLVEVIGDASISQEDPKAVIGAFYRTLQTQHISSRPVEKTVNFPYLPQTDAVEPIKSEHLSSVGASRYYYANGTVLNLKKTTFIDNSLQVAIHFGSGEKSLPKGGLSHLSEAVINGSGTATLKESELSRVLAGSSVQYRFGIGDESLRLAGSALSSDSETLFQLFQSVLRDPGLRVEAYQAAMKRFDLMYKGMNNNINGGAMLYLAPFFAGNDVTHGMVRQEEFRKLTLDDVKTWILPQFADAPLEISVVGDFEESAIVALVSKYFGSAPSKEFPDRPPVHTPLFPAGKTFEVSMDLLEDKALVQMAWLTDDYWNIQRTRRLHVLAAIIDDRLRKVIREESGDSYSPSAFSTNSKIYQGYGKIVIKVLTDTGSLDPVIEHIDGVIRSLHGTPVGSDELERSKQPLVTSIRERTETNGYWLSSVLSLSTRHPQQLDWPTSFLEDIQAITVDDITRLIDSYLIDKRRAIGIIRSGHAD